jgi:hypothetical protein
MTAIRRAACFALVASAFLAAPHPVAGQLPNASTAAASLGDGVTATARGLAAIAANPAGLAMPGSPGFAFTLLPVHGQGGITPFPYREVAAAQGGPLPDGVREQWFRDIVANGGEQGYLDADVTYLALVAGPIGVQLSTTARAEAALSPDAMELLLYGNAGRTGTPRAFDIAGSTVHGTVLSTAAVSWATSVVRGEDRHLAIGVTTKYVVGNALVQGHDDGSTIGADPRTGQYRLVLVQSDTSSVLGSGRGVGVDVGAAWEAGKWAGGLSVENVVNTFRWDPSKFVVRTYSGTFTPDETTTAERVEPLEAAPEALRAEIADARFAPAIAAGLAVHPIARVHLEAEVRYALRDGIGVDGRTRVGAGMEVRPLSFIPLRGAIVKSGDATELSAGTGLEFPFIQLLAGVSRHAVAGGHTYGAMFGLSFGQR